MDRTPSRHIDRTRPNDDRHSFSFGIISLKELTWSEHCASILEIGPDSFTIRSWERIEPGFVWFRDRILGNRGGVLDWCEPIGDAYHACIKFTPLSWNVERYVEERARRSMAHILLSDPKEIMTSHHEAPRSTRGN